MVETRKRLAPKLGSVLQRTQFYAGSSLEHAVKAATWQNELFFQGERIVRRI